jgi:hypothetical protein
MPTREPAVKARPDPDKRASLDPFFTGVVAVFNDGWHRPD